MNKITMKKYLMLLLITTLVLSSVPINIATASTLTKFATDQEFYDYVELTLGIESVKSKNGNFANRQTYNDYQQIVYGEQHGDKKEGELPWVKPGYEHLIGKMLPRYIGYDWNGDDVGNTHFTPDATSGRDPSNFDYIPNSSNIALWDALNKDVADHMLNALLWGNGAKAPFVTLNQLGGKAYGKPVSLATWLAEGSIYMRHNDGKNYVTQNVSSMLGSASGAISGTITTPSDTYYIRQNDTQVQIPVTVTARANLSGYAKASHIEEIVASFRGKIKSSKGVETVSQTTDLLATRANYSVGTHKIDLQGDVSLRTIFKDSESKTVSKTITLIVEAQGPDPYVTTTVTPNPKEKKFENKDIDVTLTVEGILHNYTDINNIVEWRFYAREKEITEAVIKKVYQSALKASTTFKMKIPASKIVGDNYIQHYVVRAEVLLKDNTRISAPAETFVNIYKVKPELPPPTVEPPVDTNKPPIAKIMGPKEVIVGSTAFFSDVSRDPDGYIAERYWIYETSGKISGSIPDNAAGGSLKFNELGYYTIGLAVNDNKGAGDYTEHEVVVVPPPPPVAALSIKGSLKENRLCVMENISYSHSTVPIVPSKTKIEITPIDHGATTNIKYSGTLTDNKIKNLTFKNAGTYKFKISVENTSGLTDTKEYVKYFQPDNPPIADFSLIQRIFRDPFDNKFAKMEITDLSFSPDGDPITEKIWSIRYNSTNNKNADGTSNFSDDPILQIKDSQLTIGIEKTYTHNGVIYKVTKTAKDKLEIKVNQIGAYLLDLEVIEGLGQDFIPDYISTTDYQKGDTSHKHHFEKTITVFNREPFVDFN